MIANISIYKIDAQHNLNIKPSLKLAIGNFISLKDVVEDEEMQKQNKDSKIIKIFFEFKIEYKTEEQPEQKQLGNINFAGLVLWQEKNTDANKENSFKEEWIKNKKLPDKYSFVIMNSILRKCILVAVDISGQTNMPPPINIPVIQKKNNQKKTQNIEYIG